MGAIGSVSRQFKEKWVIAIDGTVQTLNEKWKTIDKITPLNVPDFENYIIELPISDFEIDGNNAIIYTEKADFAAVQKRLEADKYHILEADIQYIPDNLTRLPEEEKNRFLTLIDALENDEDVNNVRHNAEI